MQSKKFLVCIIFCIIISFCLFACGNAITFNDNVVKSTPETDNSVGTTSKTHTVSITTAESFYSYFNFSAQSSFNYSCFIPESSSYGTLSTSTIQITPKLTGFVEYSGSVVFAPDISASSTDSLQTSVLKERFIEIDYWGYATDIYKLTNDTEQNDKSISFNIINYSVKTVDIIITYHHEGLSGDYEKTYHSIAITKYNYKNYISIQSVPFTNNESGIIFSNPVYIGCTINISHANFNVPYEYNNVILTFENDTIIKLDALGQATYKYYYPIGSEGLPELISVSGTIDFYPVMSKE